MYAIRYYSEIQSEYTFTEGNKSYLVRNIININRKINSMCGFGGFFPSIIKKKIKPLQLMLNQIIYRGPDSSILINNRIAVVTTDNYNRS